MTFRQKLGPCALVALLLLGGCASYNELDVDGDKITVRRVEFNGLLNNRVTEVNLECKTGTDCVPVKGGTK